MPSWEKRFCASVGITWSNLLEKKKYSWLYDNVMNWDDSAGREAFDNAKKRFWASMNDLPCDVPLLDPNTYIDDIDWNSTIDPELILNLEKDDIEPTKQGQGETVVILDSLILSNYSFSGPGWGDETDTPKHTENAHVNTWGWNTREN